MIDPKMLKKFLNRPEQMSADELEDDGKPSSQNPEKPYSVPAQIKAGEKKDLESPEEEHDIADTDEDTKLLDELQDDEPTEDEARESDGTEEQINNPDASLEMKKKAIADTLKKYLGR